MYRIYEVYRKESIIYTSVDKDIIVVRVYSLCCISGLVFMFFQIGINVCDGMLTTVTQCKSNQQVDDKMRLDKHAMSLSLTTPCVVDNLHCKYGNESDCSMYQMRFQCAVGKGKNKYKGFGYNIVLSIILITEER